MAKKAGPQGQPDADDTLTRLLDELRASISSGDVLDAEMQVSSLLALALAEGGSEEQVGRVADTLTWAVGEAWGRGTEGAAFLRLLMALGPRAVKRRASAALAEFTGDGVYPPDWVNDIGKPSAGRAYRGRDVFGDHEVIIVTFSYQDAEHALLVALDLAELPMVTLANLTADVSGLLRYFEDDELIERLEPIELSEARRRIEVPLAQAGQDPDLELKEETLAALAPARLRVRRLPAPDPGTAITYTAADRATAVGDFMGSTEAAGAGEEDTARFWAQVLTGYSSRVSDVPPAHVGRYSLSAALLWHIPRTFTLSAAQLDGMETAVTAWAGWAARRQDLGEAATATLMTRLATVLDEFPVAYHDQDIVTARGYLQDIATPDADAAWLADCRARRELAAPLPENRDPDDEHRNAADPEDRAVLVASEFGTCEPEGMPRAEFLAAATRVVEELWRDEPAATWQAGKSLLAKGHDAHDVIHLLARPRPN